MLPLKGSAQVIAAGVTLTGSYVAATVVSPDEQNYLGLLIKYTKGAEDTMQVKVDVSVDGGTTWYQQTAETATAGAISVAVAERTYTGTGNYVTVIQPIKVPQSPSSSSGQKGLVRVSYKANSASPTPTGTVTITAVVGWV